MRALRRWGAAAVMCGICVALVAQLERVPVGLSLLHQTSYLRAPVIVVVLDELPVASLMNALGHVDAATFPNFGALARRSIWYRNATTTGVFTHEALPALLTGRVDAEGRQPHNLFTMLGGAYDIHVTERFPEYCPPSSCDPPEHSRGGSWTNDFGFFPRGGRGQGVVSFIDQIRAEVDPSFHFLHTVLPHSPWRYLPSGQVYPEVEPEPGEIDMPGPGRRWSNDEWLTAQVYQRHLLQLKLVDRLLGALIHRMKAVGIFDSSLLVVTADHGIGFVPGEPKRLVTRQNLGAVAAIPLFVKLPAQGRGTVSDVPVQITDILPTIADALGLSARWTDVDGRSALLAPLSTETRTRVRRLYDTRITPSGLEKYQAIALKERLFERNQRGALELFSLSPPGTRELVGSPVTPTAPTTFEVQAHVPNLETYEAADPTAEVFPALLSGRLVGGARHSIVAIAVAGRIASVTRTYTHRSEEHFYAMLSPRFFTGPTNALDFFLLEADGSLRPIEAVSDA